MEIPQRETLLKEIDESTLRAHNICLPISKDTAHRWMLKCSAGRCNTKKTYYNDQHQNQEVFAHRNVYIKTLRRLQRQMCVWVLLSSNEEAAYVERRRESPVPDAMPLEEELIVDGKQAFVRHMDNQERWEANPVLHPEFEPGLKPSREHWHCDFGHDYEG